MSRREEEKIGRAPTTTPGPKRRIELKGGGRLRSISGVITGAITSLNVTPVKAGAYIDISIAYNAYNPNGSFLNPWKIFIVAKDSAGNKELVKDANVLSDRFSDSGSWRLWQMPAKEITLEVRLYGHDEVVPWNWAWW